MFNQILDIKLASRAESVGQTASIIQAFEAVRTFLTSAGISILIDLPFVLLFLAVIFLFAGLLVLIPLFAVLASLIVNLSVQMPLKKSD